MELRNSLLALPLAHGSRNDENSISSVRSSASIGAGATGRNSVVCVTLEPI